MSSLVRRSTQNPTTDLMSTSPRMIGTKKGRKTILDSNGSRFFVNESVQERKSIDGKETFYRRAIPQPAMPKHVVTKSQAGLWLGDDGGLVDCFGRYTSMALEG